MIRLQPSEAKKLSRWLNWRREDKEIYILWQSKQVKEHKMNIDIKNTKMSEQGGWALGKIERRSSWVPWNCEIQGAHILFLEKLRFSRLLCSHIILLWGQFLSPFPDRKDRFPNPFTSTDEIPTLSYTCTYKSLHKVLLLGRATLKRLLQRVPPQGTAVWHLPFHLPIWSLQLQQHLCPSNHKSIYKIMQQTIPITIVSAIMIL